MQDERAWPTPGLLTSDNHYLSRPNSGLLQGSAVNCNDLPEVVAGYVRESLAENTPKLLPLTLRLTPTASA
jgi:hypothetical protein